MRPPPTGPTPASDDEEDSDDDEDDSDSDDVDDFLPTANEAVMEGHKKFVSCMSLEHTGSRLLTGSHDYGVKIYDFNGMKRDLKPFREIVPMDGYPVHALSWSPSGDQFLCVTGHPQPKIFDRDGRELGEFDKGDMYIRDLKNTKGHCSPCTGGAWHPFEKQTVLTSSADGSMRVWDVNYLGNPRGAQASVLKPQLARPGRVQVTACCYSPDGSMMAGAVSDGSIQIFPTGAQGFRSASVGLVLPPSAQCHFDNHWSYASKPKTSIKGAHPPGETVSFFLFPYGQSD
jgi:WD40 repeat protein